MPIDVLPYVLALAAVLYASVGHAGASGYLVAMALCGLAPAVMKPTALILNLVVATVALASFMRAGAFQWSRFWPFALGSIPLAFIGGGLSVPGSWYRPLVGVVLLVGAIKLVHETLPKPSLADDPVQRSPRVLPAIAIGAAIGLLAGVTGTGGGIFLSPILLFLGWGTPRQSGGVAAAFILVNSAAALAGHRPDWSILPPDLAWWIVAVLAGGFVGATWGSRWAGHRAFKRCLAAVLLIAAGKLLLG